MNEEGKFWLPLWIVICFFVCLLVGIICYYTVSEKVRMAKLGYEQTMVIGYPTPVWQKCEITENNNASR